MTGNVKELVEDDPHDSYVGAPTDGSAWLEAPIPCQNRGDCTVCFENFCRRQYVIFRGGNFQETRRYVHTGYREFIDRDSLPAGLGFRVVRSIF